MNPTQKTGKSVEEAIRTRRLDEARRLLRETPLSAEEIAPRCGYENVSALRRAFARKTGLTMGAWRRANGNESGKSPPIPGEDS